MALPNTTPIDWWTTALDYGGRPPLAYLRETMLLHDREENKHLYTGHQAISDRLWVRSFRTRHQALLWVSWHAVEFERASRSTQVEAQTIVLALQALRHPDHYR